MGGPNTNLNVVSIGGASRSGSTLLAVLLGRLDGFFPVGELRYIWARGYIQNHLCGCGEPFHGCPFWRAVLEEGYGSAAQVPIREITALHDSIARVSRLPQLLSPVRTPRFDRRMNDYLFHLEKLCRAIQRVSGAHTLVDSSKQPAFCYVLSRLPSAQVQLVHLIRDSRAVAFSQMRRRLKPDIHWREAYMTRFPPPKSAFDWTFLNLAMEWISAAGVPVEVLRYEDLMRAPERELRRILASLPGREVSLPDTDEMAIPVNHSVSGNPLRFTQGTLRLRPDSEWQQRMTRRDRFVVTALTRPLLRRHGYINPRSSLREASPSSQRRADDPRVEHDQASSSSAM
jgi:hypothetical protein